MRGFKHDLAKTMDTKAREIREAEWGSMHLGIETYNEKVDLAPFFEGLPENRCSARHWGFMVRGRMLVRYQDGEEVVSAGDAYYLKPGHLAIVDTGSEMVEFSPTEEYQTIHETVERNLARMRTEKARRSA